jgi:hypothetical protein
MGKATTDTASRNGVRTQVAAGHVARANFVQENVDAVLVCSRTAGQSRAVVGEN